VVKILMIRNIDKNEFFNLPIKTLSDENKSLRLPLIENGKIGFPLFFFILKCLFFFKFKTWAF